MGYENYGGAPCHRWGSRVPLLQFHFGVALLLVSCSSSTKESILPPTKAKPLKGSQVQNEKKEPKESPDEEFTGPSLPWAKNTFSPRPGATPDPALEIAAQKCGTGDSALHDVALLVAEEHRDTGSPPDLDFARFHLRRLGSPYVMPRLWSAQVNALDEEGLAKSIDGWSSSKTALGDIRCGAGLSESEDGYFVSFLQVDVAADLSPLPTQVLSGQWLELEASFLAPTSAATVLLLPPEGPPRRLNAIVKGDKTKARFSIESSGTWLIQLMATQIGGPRPVARLLITADVRAPSSPDSRAVPGEDALDTEASYDDALFGLINAAREEHGLPQVRRNRKLDRIALAHSRKMQSSGRISHDTGVGDPEHRVAEAGLSPQAVGENVARAGSVTRLHRVLWGSPAHRENLLLRRWDEVGVAVVRGKDGSLFASQLFIDSD